MKKLKGCEVCGQAPVIKESGMCGPCTFGEADSIGEGEYIETGGVMELTDDQVKTMEYFKKNKVGTPTKVGEFLGYDYMSASSFGHRALMSLVYMGKLRKETGGKYYLNNN